MKHAIKNGMRITNSDGNIHATVSDTHTDANNSAPVTDVVLTVLPYF